jgi:soluble lytic murein transglycosylase-like protein
MRAFLPITMRRFAALPTAILLVVAAPDSAVAASVPSPDPDADAAAVVSGLRPAHEYASYVTEAARRFAIPAAWIWAIMRIESRGDRHAISPAGAMGLMQIMPATWADLSARFGLGADAFDARANIHAGAAYLRAMWDRYGDLGPTLAAYNAGPGRTDAYLAGRRSLPVETISYVAEFTRIVGVNSASKVATWAAAEPFAWRRAALFAAPSRGMPDGTEPAVGSAFGRITANDPDAQAPSNMPPSNPLFVALSGGTRP